MPGRNMMDIKQNFPLSQLTTFKIGGPADFYVAVESEQELKEALNFAHQKQLPVLVIGRGSNILVSDRGFNGLVIRNEIKGLAIQDKGIISVGAGENWDDVAAEAVAKGLAGIECLSGVPGSAGGAVVQNIGAYGQTLADVVLKVNAIEVSGGKAQSFSPKECEFEYRNSLFKRNSNKYVVTSFQLKLKPNGEPTVIYAHVKKHFDNKRTPTLSDLRQFILRIRASKGYLIMPGFDSYNTAGSFFKNPIVSQEQFGHLKPILGDPSLNRFWEMPNGIKIAAAYLTQEAGFSKGYLEGNVGISDKHSLSLVNWGGAKAIEIRALADKIKSVVLEKFGVRLEEEVLYVGKFD